MGFKPGESGRRQKLNDEDELMLETWVVDLLSKDQTIYSDTLIKMVCTIELNLYVQANYLLEKYPDRREEDKKVTRGWISGFLSRHTILKREKTQIVDSIRLDACTKLNMLPFYERFNEIRTQLHIIDELVFN